MKVVTALPSDLIFEDKISSEIRCTEVGGNGWVAGIGGIELGLNNAGHQANLFCEIQSPAKTGVPIPNIRIEPDVSQLASLPASTELLAAGFPCQDLSQAGLTKGIKGENSGLVEHVFRLLDKQPVGLVLLENVSFMLRLDNGSAMRRLVDAFEERGYRWAYRVIDTISSQRRQRVISLLPGAIAS